MGSAVEPKYGSVIHKGGIERGEGRIDFMEDKFFTRIGDKMWTFEPKISNFL